MSSVASGSHEVADREATPASWSDADSTRIRRDEPQMIRATCQRRALIHAVLRWKPDE